jgi:hypothetical protein
MKSKVALAAGVSVTPAFEARTGHAGTTNGASLAKKVMVSGRP